MFSVRRADPANHRRGAEQSFLSGVPASAACSKGEGQDAKVERRRTEGPAMRAVVQRVSRARVIVDGRTAGEIAEGLAVLLAVGRNDEPATASAMAEKVVHLRIFNDDQGKMNKSLLDVGGAVLAISQFTLYGDARGQRRPSFLEAASPDRGKQLYEEFVRALGALGAHVETGVFQTHMAVELTNDGPVTILLDSDKKF
jgi:D-aminoacyl-tRNA deacylase